MEYGLGPSPVRSRRLGLRKLSAAPSTILRYGALLLVCVVTGFGAVKFFVSMTRAATVVLPVEAEGGSHPGTAVISDTTASGGQALRFGGSTASGSCIAPAGLKPTDLDAANGGTDQIPAWRHTLGSAATIYITTAGVPSNYAGYISDGAAVWNVSPCINFQVVSTCPANSNCVTTKMVGGLPNYDGEFNDTDVDGYLASGTLNLVQNSLDQETDAYRRMVVTHEMGHAASLGHRLTKTDIMYYDSQATAALKADSINLNNILAIYGVQSGATTTPLPGQAAANNAPAEQVPTTTRSRN